MPPRLARREGLHAEGVAADDAPVSAALAVGAFLLGVVIVVWSTERLLDGMVGLAALLRAAPFVIAGVFSGLAPVHVPTRVIALDWPFLVAVTGLATVFLWRGRVTRWQGAVLLAAYAGYVTTHVLLAS